MTPRCLELLAHTRLALFAVDEAGHKVPDSSAKRLKAINLYSKADYQVVGLANHYRGYGLGVALIGMRDHEIGRQSNRVSCAKGERNYSEPNPAPVRPLRAVISQTGHCNASTCLPPWEFSAAATVAPAIVRSDQISRLAQL